MSQLRVNTITDADNGNTATINGMTPTAQSLQGFRNRIINGDMRIDQRNNGAALTATGGGGYFYAVDRFISYNLSGVSCTTQRVAEAPAGFTNSNKLTFANAVSLTTTGELTLQQVIEGFNIADFGWGAAGAQSVTVSFWVRSSFTGTFSVGITNDGGTRAYATTYTINAANTWEQKTVTIPGDTSGTWLTNNGIGMFLRFMLASGSNFVVSANNTWTTRAGAYNAADSIYGTRAIGAATSISAGATWQITGVQLEAGSVATPFERRPYGTELQLAQRYFQVPLNTASRLCNGFIYATNSAYGVFNLPVTMRAAPSISFNGSFYGLDASNTGRGMNAGTDGTTVANVSVNFTSGFNMTAGNATILGLSSSGYVWASSEL